MKLRGELVEVRTKEEILAKLRAGDLVEVRTKEEILATLDKDGRLEGLPFMPQMFEFCGRQFRVYKRAHKTCDFVYTMSSRSLADGIHLDDLRCDGSAYGGCQHACLLFWKESWLRRIHEPSGLPETTPPAPPASNPGTACTEADVFEGTKSVNEQGEVIYTCQGTELLSFTKPLAWWDVRQYIEDYASGNAGVRQLLNGFAFGLFSTFKNSGLKIGLPLRWAYDAFASMRGSTPYPRRPGRVPQGQPTPTDSLNLRPGELVRVKSYDEILATLDSETKNRGLSFDAEMVPYCGRVFRVRSVITTFIDERSRKLVKLKKNSRCVSLENAICEAQYSNCRMICPRSILPWWREIWLERVPDPTDQDRARGDGASASDAHA